MFQVAYGPTGGYSRYLRQGCRSKRKNSLVYCSSEFVSKCIVSDVDGTLLNPQQKLTPAVELAVQAVQATGIPFCVATGKARGPWTKLVLPKLGAPQPGVYMQGLLVYDAEGELIYERNLSLDIVQEVIYFAKQQGLTLTAYCGKRILCEVTDEHTDRLIFYEEPTPEAVGPLERSLKTIKCQKMIFMAPQERILEIRPLVESQFGDNVAITAALPGMLEILPWGASKGAGVQILLDHMKVDAKDVLAIGDGENDVEMLQMVGLGVAMDNASPKLKHVAQHIVLSNHHDGLAHALDKFVLEPQLNLKV
eukprot:TRINITY_DN5999_c1_g1_i1.p2 TRINITY_DN5999_c1_g1~~TRINITY_DN5999_c1_g1_i1.p2  ORF type:complete len:308 (-),score=55.20 TRINITY_DN5999_c1_g1_i1:924-1847(-)